MNRTKAVIETELQTALNDLIEISRNPLATVKEMRRLQNRVSELCTILDRMRGDTK